MESKTEKQERLVKDLLYQGLEEEVKIKTYRYLKRIYEKENGKRYPYEMNDFGYVNTFQKDDLNWEANLYGNPTHSIRVNNIKVEFFKHGCTDDNVIFFDSGSVIKIFRQLLKVANNSNTL